MVTPVVVRLALFARPDSSCAPVWEAANTYVGIEMLTGSDSAGRGGRLRGRRIMAASDCLGSRACRGPHRPARSMSRRFSRSWLPIGALPPGSIRARADLMWRPVPWAARCCGRWTNPGRCAPSLTAVHGADARRTSTGGDRSWLPHGSVNRTRAPRTRNGSYWRSWTQKHRIQSVPFMQLLLDLGNMRRPMVLKRST